MPKLIVLAFLYVKFLKKNARITVSVFLQVKLKKMPELLVPVFYI
jgi:hypothetical protein